LAKKSDRRRPLVVSQRHGSWPFQTGRVIASLLRRGLTMEQATTVAKDVRARVAQMDRVESTALVAQIASALVAGGHGHLAKDGRVAPGPRDPLQVVVAGRAEPFPRHILLRDAVAVGVDVARAGALVDSVHSSLMLVAQVVPEPLVREQFELALGAEGPEAVRRYRLIETIRASQVPVIVFLGGASGTGKSTLALELGFRLGIRRTLSTDMVRETMRAVLAPAIVPGLHDHSFGGLNDPDGMLDPRGRVIAGFLQQAAQVRVGVRAVVRRAIQEGTHLLVEGTHLLPPFSEFVPAGTKVACAGMVLAAPSSEHHRQRFPDRPGTRDSAAALNGFDAIRIVHDHVLHLAEETDSLVLVAPDRAVAPLYAMDLLARAIVG
jgi:2-phosphoglycerate kinase